jgi:hypothetical protein
MLRRPELDKLLTKDLCHDALKSPNSDKKVLDFIQDRFPEIKKSGINISQDEKIHHNTDRRIKF